MNSNEDAEQFRKLLAQFHTAMLITHTGEGRLRARPMAVAQVEPTCRIWFLSGRETAKNPRDRDGYPCANRLPE